MTLRHLRDKLTGRVAIGASPQVSRVFLVCNDCQRVVPMWRCVIAKVRPGQKVGCTCGSGLVRPRRVSYATAAYWLVLRGIVVRRVLLRKRAQDEWDPRIPVQGGQIVR